MRLNVVYVLLLVVVLMTYYEVHMAYFNINKLLGRVRTNDLNFKVKRIFK